MTTGENIHSRGESNISSSAAGHATRARGSGATKDVRREAPVDAGTRPLPAQPRKEKAAMGATYYVYAILDGEPDEGSTEIAEKGVDAAYPVYLVPHRSVRAIVSRVSPYEFGQEQLQARMNDARWLSDKVTAHHAVLRAVAERETHIPMRFCTIYRSEDRVREVLTEHYDEFIKALRRVEGRQEWGVKIWCDDEALHKDVRTTSSRAKELEAQMARQSSGAAYFMRKKIDQAIAVEAERLQVVSAQRAHDHLSAHADEAVLNSPQSREVTGRREKMILNAAYLTARSGFAAFRSELTRLQAERPDMGLTYELTGPWPPYNFVTIALEEGGPS